MRDLEAFGIIRSALQSVKNGVQFLSVTGLFVQFEQPVHDGGETKFLRENRLNSVSEQCAEQKMARQNALNIDPRVFHISDQIILQERRFVLRP